MVSEEQLLADPAASMEPIAATMKAIVDGWPADFAKAYEAACKLTHHDPILHSNAGGQ
jgi:hypothetical protein